MVARLINKLDNQIKFVPDLGMGGGLHYSDHFEVDLTRQMSDIERANFVPDTENSNTENTSNRILKYFTVSPDSKETFSLLLFLEPEYIYTFQIGIGFTFRGKDRFIWSDSYKAGVSHTIASHWKFVTEKGDPIIEPYNPYSYIDNESLLGK